MEKIHFCRGHCPDVGNPQTQSNDLFTSGNIWNPEDVCIQSCRRSVLTREAGWLGACFPSPAPKPSPHLYPLSSLVSLFLLALPTLSFPLPLAHSPFCSKPKICPGHSRAETPSIVPYCPRIEAGLRHTRPCNHGLILPLHCSPLSIPGAPLLQTTLGNFPQPP